MAYDDPNFSVRREIQVDSTYGAAGVSVRKFAFFQETKIKKVHAVVDIPGTNTDEGFDIFVGTSSVGAVVCGDAAEGVLSSSPILDVVINAGGVLDIKGAANNSSLEACLIIEHEVEPDAVRS